MKDDFRSGNSVWSSGEPAANYSPLKNNTECDVLVIGAGISGALISHALSSAGVSVVLVDKDEPGRLSTAASTGLLQYEIDTPLCELIPKVGEQKAVRAYQRGLWALEELQKLARLVGPKSEFVSKSSFYFASNWCHVRKLKEEFECRKRFGFDVEFWDSRKIRSRMAFPSRAAIWSSQAGQINPFAFTRGLLKLCEKNGTVIHGITEIESVETSTTGVVAKDSHGHSITAKRVVYSIGYDVSQFLKQSKGIFHSTYALASTPMGKIDGWHEDCLLWETARPYFYARRTQSGRIIVGGADTSFKKDHKHSNLLEKQTDKLVARFQKLFPDVQLQTEFRWAGTFGETADGMAYIGAHPAHPHAYFALGYGGNGITFSTIAARLITDLYLNRPNPDREVFAFNR